MTVEGYLAQFDHAVRLFTATGDLLASNGLAVMARNTRLFLAGDLVVVWFANGMGERWPVYGRSSRGYDVADHYVQGARWRERGIWTPAHESHGYKYPARRGSRGDQYHNKAAMRLVDVPREVSSECSTAGAAPLRRWLSEALSAGCAAGGVGAGSPALPLVADERPPRSRRRQRAEGDADGVMW